MDIINLINGEKLWTGRYWGMVGTIQTIAEAGDNIQVATEEYTMIIPKDKVVWYGIKKVQE